MVVEIIDETKQLLTKFGLETAGRCPLRRGSYWIQCSNIKNIFILIIFKFCSLHYCWDDLIVLDFFGRKTAYQLLTSRA